MGAHYIMTVNNSSDVAAKLAQIASEQSSLLTSLGLTLSTGTQPRSVWSLKRTGDENAFEVYGDNGGQMYTQNESGVMFGHSQGSTFMHHFLFTEKSIMIVARSSGSPSNGISAISKNDDGKVIVVAISQPNSSPYNDRIWVKDKNYGSNVDFIPMFYGTYYVEAYNYSQIALANIPMQGIGEVCNNAFIALCKQSVIQNDLAIIGGVEYAIASTNYTTYACR
jgi:hypothetical protein